MAQTSGVALVLPPHSDRSRLQHIARALSRVIPEPAQKRAKPQKSWRLLREGQLLELKTQWYLPQLGTEPFPRGTRCRVNQTDSRGVSLVLLRGSDGSNVGEVRWEDPEWGEMFNRVRGGSRGKRKSDS